MVSVWLSGWLQWVLKCIVWMWDVLVQAGSGWVGGKAGVKCVGIAHAPSVVKNPSCPFGAAVRPQWS